MMKKTYVIVKIEYREFEQYLTPDYKIIFDEVDKKSRFKSLEEAEDQLHKILKKDEKGFEYSILTVYSKS